MSLRGKALALAVVVEVSFMPCKKCSQNPEIQEPLYWRWCEPANDSTSAGTGFDKRTQHEWEPKSGEQGILYPAGTGAAGQRAGGADRQGHRRVGRPRVRDFQPGVSAGACENEGTS